MDDLEPLLESLLVRERLFREDFQHRLQGELKAYIDERLPVARGRQTDDASSISYRVPGDLAVTPTPIRRIMILGSCLAESWHSYAAPRMPVDYIFVNHAAPLPENPPQPFECYDFALAQIPLRSIIPDGVFFRAGFASQAEAEAVFDECSARLMVLLNELLVYNARSGLLTFVSNFMLPQQNPSGRLFPRYDLRNLVHFIDELNRVIGRAVDAREAVHVLDVDQICATHGRRYLQNDISFQANHGGSLNDWGYELDQNRIEPLEPLSAYYPVQSELLAPMVLREAEGMWRSTLHIDAVKLIIIDLDDTLWRGLLVEDGDSLSDHRVGGWPLGLVEALLRLKRNGILLAISSKNDRLLIEKMWDDVFFGAIHLSDFVSVKIDWKLKAENVRDIIESIGILPNSVLFIDDNPVERQAVVSALPGVRALGSNPYLLKRLLLWAPETQVTHLTAESSRRTELTEARIRHHEARSTLTREAFLHQLDLRVSGRTLVGVEGAGFGRAVELFNRTNQFNSTGQKRTTAEVQDLLSKDAKLLLFDVEDKHASYGSVIAILISDDRIIQMAMSCRVAGLGVEQAVLIDLFERLRKEGFSACAIEVRPTGRNAPGLELLELAGFRPSDDGLWRLPLESAAQSPGHISLTIIASDRSP